MKLLKNITVILVAVALTLTGAACSREVPITDVTAPTAAVPAATAAPTPAGGEAADSGRDRYDIAMTIDTESCRITETVGLTAHNYSDDEWNELVLRDYMARDEMYGGGAPAGDEGISAVTLEGGEALAFAPDADDPSIVRIALPAPLAPDASISIRLSFSATVSATGDRCQFGTLSGAADARTIELSQCFPVPAIYENGGWVCEPYFTAGECMYSRCADYEITLSLPAGWVAIATGDEQPTANGGSTDWRISARNVRDMTIIASNELAVISDTVGDITVNSYYGRDGALNRLQGEESLCIATEAAAFYEASFGAYPYGELDVVQSCNEVGGIEAPGIIRISHIFASNLGPDGGDADSHLIGNNVAHETAHQWFYGVVGNNQYREAWLDEGLASVSALLYAKHCGWGQAYVDERLALIDWLLEGADECYIDSPYDELKDAYSLTAYQRAEKFLYRLCEAMGDENFLSFLNGYYSELSFKEATTADFLEALMPYIASNAAAQALVRENIAAASCLLGDY